MVIRRYRPSDCAQMADLFYHTVHAVNAKDYSQEQLCAWADGKINLKEWNRSFSEHFTIVAAEQDKIIGFGDMDLSGYLDRLYVHKDFQRQGVAAAICNALEQAVSASAITTQASVTAKPFFEHRGYRVVRKQQVMKNGVSFTNYLMEKTAK